MKRSCVMKRVFKGLVAATLLAATGMTVHGSSHREALAILNEPCADNTDTYAWVSDGLHDKLYLIMDFNPLHEPGQGNQGLRACNGYRYEFHIAKGKSLKDEVVYRVEFTNRLKPEAAPSADRSARRRQRAALAAHRRHRDHEGHAHRRRPATGWNDRNDDDDDVDVLGRNLPVLPNNHGPQTDRLVYGLGPFKGYDSGDPTSREVGLYDQPFVDTFIHHAVERRADHRRPVRRSLSARREGDLRPGQPEHATTSAASPGRAVRRAKDVFTGFNLFSIALEVPITDIFPHGIPHNGQLKAELHRQPAPGVVAHHPPADADRRSQQHHHRPQGVGRLGAGRPQRPAAVQRRPRRHAASDPLPAQQPDARRDQLRRRHPVPGAGARRRGAGHLRGAGRSAGDGGDAERAPRWTSSTPSTWAGRFRSPTASPATSSPSTRRSIRASRTAGAWAAGPRRTAIR